MFDLHKSIFLFSLKKTELAMLAEENNKKLSYYFRTQENKSNRFIKTHKICSDQGGFFLREIAEKVEIFQEIRYYLMNSLNLAWKIDKFKSGL